MNKTKIPWANYTWNPITGCSPASEGCAHCYAAAISKRFHLPWGKPIFHPDRLDEPRNTKKPGRVFVCSMSDLGHEGVEWEWREEISNVMLNNSRHTFIVLTKRPGSWLRELPINTWVGVTIENDKNYIRWNRLLAWAWPGSPVKFVSVEPILSAMTFSWLPVASRPDWTIVGPETGPSARTCDPKWIDALSKKSPCFYDKRPGAKRKEFPA